jgi:hypothetical protein
MKYKPQAMSCTDVIEIEGDTIAELWTGDLIDERGHVYSDGCHQVKITSTGRKLSVPFKTKTWKGESAWMNAGRVWSDLTFWVRREMW